MIPQKSRALRVLTALALSAIALGIAALAGAFAAPFAQYQPAGVDARTWAELFLEVTWGLIFGGILALVAVFCVKFVRALDEVKRAFPDAKRAE